ncbi:DUF58 domain-containing protein [Nitrosophilus labii]|uniref:DUF58 domain-containing protein n=1 Tax=Nitrosophilus labii TaxID=2706014 RepID=UPI001657119A|nr:DUF58 domain-containing protein [Nitrosophilus labii]
MDIETLIIKTKKEVFSNSVGVYSTNVSGEGYDFLELKEYDFESDAKKIDWLISAKMQKPYVRVNQEEKRRNIVAVFLLSGSLFFGSKRLKIETLLEAFAILGFSSIKSGDIFRSGYILQNSIKLSLPYKNIFNVEEELYNIDSIELVGLKPAFNSINELFYAIKEKSFVIFLGDFLYDIDLTLFSQKHEILAIVARDSIEKGINRGDEAELVDNENFKNISYMLNSKNLKKYGKNIEKELQKNYIKFRENGIGFIEIFDNDEIFIKLQHYFLGK